MHRFVTNGSRGRWSGLLFMNAETLLRFSTKDDRLKNSHIIVFWEDVTISVDWRFEDHLCADIGRSKRAKASKDQRRSHRLSSDVTVNWH